MTIRWDSCCLIASLLLCMGSAWLVLQHQIAVNNLHQAIAQDQEMVLTYQRQTQLRRQQNAVIKTLAHKDMLLHKQYSQSQIMLTVAQLADQQQIHINKIIVKWPILQLEVEGSLQPCLQLMLQKVWVQMHLTLAHFVMMRTASGVSLSIIFKRWV